MLTGKQKKMAEFYRQCAEKGYVDMHDDVQSLKAKVIAVDLGLNYGNIVSFYEEAKKAYEIEETARAAEEQRRREEESRRAAAEARKAVGGELLITLTDSRSKDPGPSGNTIRSYLRPDGSFYYTYNGGEKIEGYPNVFAQKASIVETTFHPSQTVFTGASVGGVMTGGFHQTQASVSERLHSTDKGDICAKVGEKAFKIYCAFPSEYVCGLFRRDGEFGELAKNGCIVCYKANNNASVYTNSLARDGADYATRMNLLNYALDEMRIPYKECQRIMNLLNRIIKGVFPDSDETVYQRALGFSDGTSSSELKRALDGFRSISGYRDADKRAERVQEKFEEVLQGEKEQAILERERQQAQRKKSRKKGLTVFAAVSVAVIALALLLSNVILPRARYAKAGRLYEAGAYGEAAALYKRLGDYEDSKKRWLDAYEKNAVQLEEKQRRADYEKAVSCLQNGRYEEAAGLFQALGDYEDSAANYTEAVYQLAVWLKTEGRLERAKQLFETLGDYKESRALLAEADSQITEAQNAQTYQRAVSLLAYGEKANPDKIAEARELLLSISGYQDSKEILSRILYREIKRSRSNGETVVRYDSQGTELSGKPSERYSFDASGRVTSEKSNIGTYTYAYNDSGQLVRRYLESKDKSYSSELTLTYDAGGLLKQSQEVAVKTTKKEMPTRTCTDTITTTTTTSYSYNAQGLPTVVTKEVVRVVNNESDNYRKTERDSATTKYEYDAKGRVIKESSPDWIYTTEYDGRGRIASQLVENLSMNPGSIDRLIRYVYTYEGDKLKIDAINNTGGKHWYKTVYYGYIYAPNYVESNNIAELPE